MYVMFDSSSKDLKMAILFCYLQNFLKLIGNIDFKIVLYEKIDTFIYPYVHRKVYVSLSISSHLQEYESISLGLFIYLKMQDYI